MTHESRGRETGLWFYGECIVEVKKETPQERYHKAHTVSLNIRLMKNTEQDIINKLNSVPNKAGYIKSLIRADIGE